MDPTCAVCGARIRWVGTLDLGAWVHTDPDYDPFRPPIHAPSPSPSPVTEEEARRPCSTCGAACRWAEDAWYCPACGDEFYTDVD
jgi:hypothetical protein